MMADSAAVRQQHTVSYMWANMVSTATKDARMRQTASSISEKHLPTGPVAKPIPQLSAHLSANPAILVSSSQSAAAPQLSLF